MLYLIILLVPAVLCLSFHTSFSLKFEESVENCFRNFTSLPPHFPHSFNHYHYFTVQMERCLCDAMNVPFDEYAELAANQKMNGMDLKGYLMEKFLLYRLAPVENAFADGDLKIAMTAERHFYVSELSLSASEISSLMSFVSRSDLNAVTFENVEILSGDEFIEALSGIPLEQINLIAVRSNQPLTNVSRLFEKERKQISLVSMNLDSFDFCQIMNDLKALQMLDLSDNRIEVGSCLTASSSKPVIERIDLSGNPLSESFVTLLKEAVKFDFIRIQDEWLYASSIRNFYEKEEELSESAEDTIEIEETEESLSNGSEESEENLSNEIEESLSNEIESEENLPQENLSNESEESSSNEIESEEELEEDTNSIEFFDDNKDE